MMILLEEPTIGQALKYGFYIYRRILLSSLEENDPRRQRFFNNDASITEYLHLDGQWRLSTENIETHALTGYYETKEQAQKIMECY